MKKLILVVFLSVIASNVFADVGLFFDDTARYGRTGIIQANVNAPLYQCPTFASCEQIGLAHQRVAIFFSNFSAMKFEIQERLNRGVIASSRFVHTKKGKGFRIDVYDVVDIEGREFVLLGIKASNKKPKTNKDISRKLVGEIYQAYNRSAY